MMATPQNFQEDSTPKAGRDPLTGKTPRKGYLRDSVQVFNERTAKYEAGWEHRFNKRYRFDFFKKLTINSNATVYSNSFYCAPYRHALIIYNIERSGDGTQTLHIEVEFSWDNVNFYPYWENWWGYDQYVDAQVDNKVCMPLKILAPYIRFKYTSANCDAQTYLENVDIFGIFNST